MTLLNSIPLVGTLVACVIGVLILLSKNQSKAARVTLSVIVFLNAHNLFESYLYYNDLNWPTLGLSYVHYHLTGPLFLLYTFLIFKWPIKQRYWFWIMGLYTLLRFGLLIQLDEDILDRQDDFPVQMMGLLTDYFISILINLIPLVIAFVRIQRIKFVVKLDAREQLNFNWLKSLLVLLIGTYLAILAGGIISLFDGEQWKFYEKIESMLTSIFPLFVAFSAIRFPVFAIHGDFKDLPKDTEKYAKSSLTPNETEVIWQELDAFMKEECPYRNLEYRLNDLSEQLNRSLHHVSQVINERSGMSFSDFMNQYRVKEAKALLTSERAKQVTILAICYEAGFNSKTAFYNTFKKFAGQTPTEFRQAYEAQQSGNSSR